MQRASARPNSPTSAGRRASTNNSAFFVFLSGNNQAVEPVCDVTELLTGCARGLQEASACAHFVPTAEKQRELAQQQYKIYETKVLGNMHELAAENDN